MILSSVRASFNHSRSMYLEALEENNGTFEHFGMLRNALNTGIYYKCS